MNTNAVDSASAIIAAMFNANRFIFDIFIAKWIYHMRTAIALPHSVRRASRNSGIVEFD